MCAFMYSLERRMLIVPEGVVCSDFPCKTYLIFGFYIKANYLYVAHTAGHACVGIYLYGYW